MDLNIVNKLNLLGYTSNLESERGLGSTTRISSSQLREKWLYCLSSSLVFFSKSGSPQIRLIRNA